jgi:cellulase/cellobiase CelA1
MRDTTRWTMPLAAVCAMVGLMAGATGAHAVSSPTPAVTSTPAASATPVSSTPPVSSTSPSCIVPGPAPTGVSARTSLVTPPMSGVAVTVTWTPLLEPEGCTPATLEIDQVKPGGSLITTSAARGSYALPTQPILTDFIWRLRFVVDGTAGEWATVTAAKVYPLDYCLALPNPRPIVATVESPTSVHLEWGVVNYPAECNGNVTVSGGPQAITLSRTQTGVTVTGLTPGTTYTWTVAFLVTLGTVTVTQPDVAGSACTATVHVDSTWNRGSVATVTVKNTSDKALGSWSARWPLPAGARIDSVWNATGTTDGGTFTATGQAWNGQLAPGAGTTFGLLVDSTADAAIIPAFTCTGSPNHG